MKKGLLNILNLSIKELRTLFRDKVMLILIVYSFTFAIYIGSTETSTEIKNASIAFVDEDRSMLSTRIIESFYKPRFNTPDIITLDKVDEKMDEGYYTFVVVIPPSFEKDVLSGYTPAVQVNIDATRMSQSGIGAGYIQSIIMQEVSTFLGSSSSSNVISLLSRYKYNPNLDSSWFGAINEVINNIVMLSILLSAAALIREREHGTIEHLMVLPINSIEIMLAKIISVCIIILLCVIFSLIVVVQMILSVPLSGSLTLFIFSTLLILFATTSMGIFIGTVAKNMPQMGMIFILTILPLMMLSGGITPYESMPLIIQYIMYMMPTSHFVDISQAVLFKGADISLVWKDMLSIFLIGLLFFTGTFMIFRRSMDIQK